MSRRKSIEEKKAIGTYLPGRDIKVQSIVGKQLDATPPKRYTKEEKEIWLEAYEQMNDMKMLTYSDGFALDALVCSIKAFRDACAHAKLTGTGHVTAISRSADMRRWLTEFGMTPASKQKLGILAATAHQKIDISKQIIESMVNVK